MPPNTPPPQTRCPLSANGHSCPAACLAGPLASEARRWLTFVVARGLPPAYAAEKLADALALSLRSAAAGGPLAQARALLVPTKLVGTAAFQPALRALRASGRAAGLALRLAHDKGTGRVAVFAGDDHGGSDLLGLIQAKHAWLGPLVAHGAAAILLQVTGDPDRGHTHGCNVALTGLGRAIGAYLGERATHALVG